MITINSNCTSREIINNAIATWKRREEKRANNNYRCSVTSLYEAVGMGGNTIYLPVFCTCLNEWH